MRRPWIIIFCFAAALWVWGYSPGLVYADDPVFVDTFQNLGSSHTWDVALGDLDGDKDLDAFVVNGNDQPNQVWLNDGNGNFSNSEQYLGGATSFYVKLGDIDGDLDLDALISNRDGQGNEVWLNDGNGHFVVSNKNISESDGIPILGDLNNDNTLDVFWGSEIWLNNGNGNFISSEQNFEGDIITLGDVDGDGDLDAIIEDDENFNSPEKIWLNDGNGNFSDSGQKFGETDSGTIILGDIDGDGDLDGLANEKIWLNDGSGEFRNGTHEVDISNDAALGDINADGNIDIVTSGQIWLNEGNESFRNIAQSFHGETIKLGDLDGDGDLDVFVGHIFSFPNRVFLNNARANFIDSDQNLSNVGSQTIVLGDLDGDKDFDAFIGNNYAISRDDEVWLNDGVNNFRDSGQRISNDYTEDVVMGDLDGDSDLDVFTANTINEVWLNNGSGFLQNSGQNLGFGLGTKSIALGDLDSDNDLDALIVDDFNTGRVWLNGDGHQQGEQGTFTNNGQILEIPGGDGLALGDLDGDGDLDLFAANGNNRPNQIWSNDGTGQLMNTDQPLGNFWSSNVALGDLDADGDLDAFVTNYSQEADRIWLNDGYGVFVDNGQNFDDSSGLDLVLGDIDGDGDLDTFVGNHGGNNIWLNNGAGNFSDSGLSLGNSKSEGVALADLDGDSDLDAFVGNGGNCCQEADKVWLNLARGNDQFQVTLNYPESIPVAAQPYWTPLIFRDTTLPITYTLFEPEGDPMRFIKAYYSPVGGGQWFPATPATGTITRNLAAGQIVHRAAPTATLPLPLADGGTVEAGFDLAEAETMTDLNVWLSITHTLNADLEAILVSPDGLTTTLFSTETLTGSHLSGTVFDDQALTPIISGTATYGGRYRPQESLAKYRGQASQGTWRLRLSDRAGGGSGSLLAWGLTFKTARDHVFHWHAAADLIKSDNVVFRIEAYQGGPGPFQWPYASATTFPFRVEAAEWYAKVVNEAGQPLAGTTVIQNGQPITLTVGGSSLTNKAGLLRLDNPSPGTRLVALAPVYTQPTSRAAHDGWAYRTYLTSLPLDSSGVPSPTLVGQPGEQRLVVRQDSPLILFNLVASVEWDASDGYLKDLEAAFENASAYLYDVTDGQMAFGQVTIYDQAQFWADADFQFSTKNTVRPYAFRGAVTSADKAHTIRLGRAWDGDSGSVGPWSASDGYRTMIHEFGHYALYLYDAYTLQPTDDEGNLQDPKEAQCTTEAIKTNDSDETNATMMYYQYNATELADKSYNWNLNCEYTDQFEQTGGESDWETVVRFYPELTSPTQRGGLMTGPAAYPAELPPARISRVNGGSAGGPPITVTVKSEAGQAVDEAFVALKKFGADLVLDQGSTDNEGRIEIYGATENDTIRAATFDGALFNELTVGSDSEYELILYSTAASSVSSQSSATPYLRLMPGTDGDTLTLRVDGAQPENPPLTAVVIPGEGAGGTENANLSYSAVEDAYEANLSLAGVGLGTGRIEVYGKALPADLNSAYNLQRSSATTTTHLYAEDGNFELIIPPGGTDHNGYATVQPTGYVPGPLPAGRQVIGSAYEVRLSGVDRELDKDGLIRLHYHPDISGDYEELAIYYWEAGRDGWQFLGGEADAQLNALSLPRRQLGIYALMGLPTGSVESDQRIYLPLIVK